jgi:hypothetical protein
MDIPISNPLQRATPADRDYRRRTIYGSYAPQEEINTVVNATALVAVGHDRRVVSRNERGVDGQALKQHYLYELLQHQFYPRTTGRWSTSWRALAIRMRPEHWR